MLVEKLSNAKMPVGEKKLGKKSWRVGNHRRKSVCRKGSDMKTEPKC